jgi:hypothetical protein
MTELFIDPAYKKGLEQLGLISIEAVFSFQAGKNLTKDNLAPHRSRIEFQIGTPATTVFLKRYDRPPVAVQLKSWFSAGKRTSCAFAESEAAQKLAALGVNMPKVVAWGEQWGAFFEKRSFVIIGKVPNGESLESRLPDFFNSAATTENFVLRRRFIERLAVFIRKFHDTGYRHRDLYLCHIFRTDDGLFFLIDLARAFRPACFKNRYRVKDLAQLHYSASAGHFSETDRLRFLREYLGRKKLNAPDKALVRQIKNKAGQMARHNAKHGRIVPFAT